MACGGSKPGEHRGGRKKGVKNKTTIVLAESGKTLEEMARAHSTRALEILRDIAENGESEAARIAAVNALLDRGYGRPPQAPPLKEEDKPFNVDSIDLREFSKLVLHLLHKAAMRQREQQEIDGTIVNQDGQNGTEERYLLDTFRGFSPEQSYPRANTQTSPVPPPPPAATPESALMILRLA